MSFAENSTEPMVERLSVVALEPKTKPKTQPPSTPESEPVAAHESPTPPPPQQTAPPPKADDSAVVWAAAKMMMAALSLRALLAVAFLGAFILGGVTIWRADSMSAIVLTIYCTATIVPITLLEMRRK